MAHPQLAIPYYAFSGAGLGFAKPAVGKGGCSVRLLRPPRVQLCLEGDPPLTVERVEASQILLAARHAALTDALAAFDRFAAEAAAAHCAEWFSKDFSPELVESMLRPCARRSPDGQDELLLRHASDLLVWRPLGPGRVRAADASELEPGCRVWACVELSGLYFLPREFGVVLTLTDALLLPAARECPFVVGGLALQLEEEADLVPTEAPAEDVV